ncbi:MAG: hypothetical protein AB7V22_09885, partial [Kiritimatiellia bacterium]
ILLRNYISLLINDRMFHFGPIKRDADFDPVHPGDGPIPRNIRSVNRLAAHILKLDSGETAGFER